MQVHRSTDQLPLFRNAVITIGSFDGVHLGHRALIAQMKSTALACDGETVLITFHPHPRAVLRQGQQAVALITSLEERIALLSELGVDHLVIVPFTDSFAQLSAEAYIADFLVAHFHPCTLIIGYDHRFGAGRSGNYQLLEAFQTQFGYKVKEIDAALNKELAISSTRIRKALVEGDLPLANQLLGYPFRLGGIVVKGKQLGRTIGYPTANIQPTAKDKALPANGVYAVWVSLPHQIDRKMGMLNIGTRPTVDGSAITIEVHILDFEGDLYDQYIEVAFIQFLRPEKRFEGLAALQAQLAEDKRQAAAVLG